MSNPRRRRKPGRPGQLRPMTLHQKDDRMLARIARAWRRIDVKGMSEVAR